MSATVNTELHDLLVRWLPEQRWFGGKGQAIKAVEIESSAVLLEAAEDDVVVRHLLLRVDAEGGAVDRYQLLIGTRTGEMPQRLQHAVIGEADGATVYEAVHDTEATSELLRRIIAGEQTPTVRFTATSDELDPTLTSRVIGAEQSNTSLVYGEDYILKVFRRLQPGLNPDLEVTRALADAGSLHVAPPLAWIDGDVDGQPTTLGMMQSFLRNASEGWAMATASVRDLFAEGDLHADEVGGDFAGEAERLGAATAEVHALMARTLPSRTAGPDDSQATARQLHERLEAATAIVSELAPYADRIRAVYAQIGALTEPVPIQRVHGDLHLGQVLRTQDHWVLLDFEGEPARSLAERTALMSPLRDVAGMLRSFDYAARHLLAERPGEQHLAYRAAEWADRNREAFCDGYAKAAGSDPREASVLLRAFELDKAVYEVVYEARNRPSWLPIPLASIERLVEGTPA
ncbi:MAG: maltokinase [Actinomycetota bacterium]|jgi:maltokinase|nr:maltokinase [Actinomycetota bacterium]